MYLRLHLTIAEYEEELCRSKEKNERQQKLLDAVFNPQLRLHRAELPQQHVCKEEEVLSDQELNMPVITSVVSEANSDHQLLSHNSHEAESHDQKGSKHGDSGSTTNAEPEPKKRRRKSRSHKLPQQHVCKEEEVLSDQQLCIQERNSSLDQEDPEPPQIKEEQDELFTSQEEEQLVLKQEMDNFRHSNIVNNTNMSEIHINTQTDVQQLSVVKAEVPLEQQEWSSRLEEADIKLPFTSVPVKSEDDEEKAQSSQLHESQTEENREAERTGADGEDCGGPEPARNSDPDNPLQPATHDKTSDSSESQTDASGVLEETREPQSGLNSLQNNEVAVSDVECNTGNTSVSSSECAGSFGRKKHLQKPSGVQTGVKPFCCSVCELPQQHVCNEGEVLSDQQLCIQERNSCLDPEPPQIKEEQEELCTSQEEEQLVLKQEMDTFRHSNNVNNTNMSEIHINTQTDVQQLLVVKAEVSPEQQECETNDWEETREPQSGLNPLQNNKLVVSDVKCNTGNTSVSSSECAGSFGHKKPLQNHSGVQTRVKPFCCSVCGKRYLMKKTLTTHMKLHSEEKCYTCSVCKASFCKSGNLVKHMRIHTGEKPFSCSICGKRFTQKQNLKPHLAVHMEEKTFSCSVCSKRFALKQYLKKHLSVHMGEK
ncbi:zinc finger protein 2 homolog [Perca flavescens]|uniref:zinc finger protein 2 homolog n=1 Tax=Perca flavescens TaxID=8167 RepID=UPI00106DD8C1|nr:zinc finger protein 2 homolog [Perca flavescens]